MARKRSDKSLADPVSHAELDAELSRLRGAIALLANCVGGHVISSESARRLMDLLAAPHERPVGRVKSDAPGMQAVAGLRSSSARTEGR